jgi:CubicO group peptidase (beta-lactamase class C family)
MRKHLFLVVAVLAILSASGRRLSSDTPRRLNLTGAVTAQANGAPSVQSDESAHITHIENGLLPAVTIKGQPTPAMTIWERMKHYDVPGVSVAFFDHGQILWTQTYGFADVTNQKPVTTETLFQAASISKPVSALVALRLVQDGKLTLDGDVNAKLRSWKVPENEFTKEQKVTLRRILSHSAGLTVHGFPGYAAGEPLPTIVEVLNGENPANTPPVRVDTVPGTLWRYSGGGYLIMQLLLTDVTGKSFPQLVRDLVLQPAGMTHSTFDQPLPENLSSIAATPYRGDGKPVKGGWHTYPEMAAAGLWTTPSDLARLAIEVQKEYSGESSKILSQATMREMLAPEKGIWGLGFEVVAPSHTPYFGHAGANEGFKCDLEAYTDSQGFVIMTNSDNGDLLGEEVFRAVSKEYGWPDVKPKERTLVDIDAALLSAYSGTYEGPETGTQIVSVRDNKLYIQVNPPGPAEPEELYPESTTDFFILSRNVTFSFRKGAQGVVSELVMHNGTQDYEAKKLSSSDLRH